MNLPPENIKMLLTQCSDGNRKAQSELYTVFYREFIQIPLRYMSNREEAEGIFNNGMLKIFNNSRRAKDIENILGWAYRIIHNTCIDHLRSTTNYKKKHFLVANYTSIDTNDSVNDILDNLLVEDIFKHIQQLPNAERTVFSLYEIDGYKHKEIATRLNITVSHSKYLLHHAKKKLRQSINIPIQQSKNS